MNNFQKSFGVIAVLSMIVMTSLITAGCTTTGYKEITTYQDASIPKEEHTRVSFHREFTVTKYDNIIKGNPFTKSVLSDFWSGDWPAGKLNVCFIPAGEHKFLLNFERQTGSGGAVDTYLTAENIPFNLDFLPGHLYFIYPKVNGRLVQVQALDATNITQEELDQLFGVDSDIKLSWKWYKQQILKIKTGAE